MDDQIIGGLGSAMPFVFLSEEILNIERLAFTCVQGANPLINLGAQALHLLDVRQQPTTNLFLIRVGQVRNFRDRYFECPHHLHIVSHRRAHVHGILGE
jgi:hypothetical protein